MFFLRLGASGQGLQATGRRAAALWYTTTAAAAAASTESPTARHQHVQPATRNVKSGYPDQERPKSPKKGQGPRRAKKGTPPAKPPSAKVMDAVAQAGPLRLSVIEQAFLEVYGPNWEEKLSKGDRKRVQQKQRAREIATDPSHPYHRDMLASLVLGRTSKATFRKQVERKKDKIRRSMEATQPAAGKNPKSERSAAAARGQDEHGDKPRKQQKEKTIAESLFEPKLLSALEFLRF